LRGLQRLSRAGHLSGQEEVARQRSHGQHLREDRSGLLEPQPVERRIGLEPRERFGRAPGGHVRAHRRVPDLLCTQHRVEVGEDGLVVVEDLEHVGQPTRAQQVVVAREQDGVVGNEVRDRIGALRERAHAIHLLGRAQQLGRCAHLQRRCDPLDGGAGLAPQ
jgi:hypothetical protein